MLAVVACLFPVIVIGAAFWLRPVRIPTESELSREHFPDARPPDPDEEYGYEWPNILLAAALTLPLGFAQSALLLLAGRTDAAFSYRLSDFVPFPFLLTFFVAIVVAFPFCFERVKRQLGPALLEVLSRPGWSHRHMAIGQQVRAFPYEAIAIAVIVTAINTASFHTFLVISRSEIRYSGFFSPVTIQRAISDIEELRVHQLQRAPSGRYLNKQWLEIRFANGQRVDTSYLIDEGWIRNVIAAVEAAPDFKGHVIRDPR